MPTETSTLTAENVRNVYLSCLFMEGENTSTHIACEGITQTVGFHPGRIKEHRGEIHGMLAELPVGFKSSGGGGYSFLYACMDKDGDQWAGTHRTQEQLVLLGLAIGEIEYCLPREAWPLLPGGVPFFVVKQ